MPRVTFLLGTAGALLCLTACSSPRPAVSLNPSDVQLAHRFLDSLFRPDKSSYNLIVDASSEEMLGHIPLTKRNRDLRARLVQLRAAPAVIRVVLHSGDQPPPWGSSLWRYVYDRQTGGFIEEGRWEPARRSHDLSMDIRHWQDGTRLVSLSVVWLADLNHDTFHLRRSENMFRFVISIVPCID
jgi:hypothetical protein